MSHYYWNWRSFTLRWQYSGWRGIVRNYLHWWRHRR